MHQTAQTACPHCGRALDYGVFTCRACGASANQRQVDDIAAEALRLEAFSPSAAATVWKRALDLLPPESQQFRQIEQHAAALTGEPAPAWPRTTPPPLPYQSGQAWADQRQARPIRPPDPLGLALVKTFGSMIVAAVIYYLYPFHSVTIAVGFVVLMLIHEMGHVLATWYYGLSASPPIFIPYLGALINLRESPPNALVESIIGIGGPMLGTAGAVACYLLAIALPPSRVEFDLLVVAQLAFMLNLFNLLPVPPLDGGRVTAAVSPWIWIAGLAGLGVLMFLEVAGGAFASIFILLLLLAFALPRIRATFQARGMHIPYYNISKAASWTMGTLYVALGAFLVFMFHHLGGFALLQMGIQ